MQEHSETAGAVRPGSRRWIPVAVCLLVVAAPWARGGEAPRGVDDEPRRAVAEGAGPGDGETTAPAWSVARGAPRFAPLAWLEGEWQGYGRFTDRVTYIRKVYGFEVGGTYFSERTLDMFPPAEPSTDFEMHQDLSLFYRYGSDGAIRARTFFVEGFVTTAEITVGEDGGEIVVSSVEIDNAPAGLRTRYTIARLEEDRYRGTFEMAPPGGDFAVVEELEMQRVR